MNIYVGNLSFSVTETDLREAFAAYGQVATASIIKDKFSGESRGFGFVEMPTKEEAEKAITALNGKDLKGRTMTVNEAKPRTDRPRTTGGGGGGGRGGFGGGRRF
jgi:RNA recognition motif-containing protein